MNGMSFRQKILLGDRDPVVLLRGKRQSGLPFFAYVVLSPRKLTQLNEDMRKGTLITLADYGTVVMEGEGEPSEEQKAYMNDHYGFFDHTDPFAEDEEDEHT